MTATTPLLEMRDIVKSFFGVRVLDQVSVDLYAGEVLALLGENGAGKSTLIKILNGDYQKDSGTILIHRQPVHFHEPRDAEQHGISMIYQELHYAPDLNVAENLLLGHLPHRPAPFSFMIDWAEAQRKAEEYLALLKVNISPRALMRDLSVVEREIVEIVKALVIKAQIIVMDEPTAALTPREVDLLFDIIRNLRDQGVAIIFISHRLDEIPRIADRVTVLRDGKHVGTRLMRETTQREIVKMMVGREVDETASRSLDTGKSQKPVVLSVSGLTQKGNFEDVNLEVRQGEILGIFGLLGAGHTHLTRAIFGAEKIDSGSIAVEAKSVNIRSPHDARKACIGFVPIDRKVQGLILDMNVRENITLSNWKGISNMGFFRGGEERTRAGSWIERLGIRMAGGMETRIRYLSGGNQQKVILARWLEANVKVLLLNEPTWGVDVGARADIYQQIEALAGQGLALLVVSSDIQEVLSVSHRILTMHKGRITEEISHAEATQETLLHAAAGGKL
jgi:ribose transport system ATP-binding protein